MRIECCIFIIHPRFDHHIEPVLILPRRGYRLVARGQATEERHPGLGEVDGSPSAQEFSKERLDGIGRKEPRK